MKPLKIGELAKKTGLTVRALHHYDDIGLLSPSYRSDAGYRLYGEKDLQRLQKLMYLQLMGFSLTEIKICLEKEDFPFQELAKAHLNRLQTQIEVQTKLYNRIETIITALHHEDALSMDNVIATIKAIVMYEKYYTPEQMETLKKRQSETSPEELAKAQADWQTLFQDFEKAFKAGKAVSDPEVIQLGQKANALIQAFTGGDPAMEKSLQNMYSTEGGHNILSEHGVPMSAELFQFLANAMGEAKKR